MWTVTINQTDIANGAITATVSLVQDGINRGQYTFRAQDNAALKSAVRTKIAELEREDVLRAALPANGSTFDYTSVQTQADIDKAAFVADLELMRQCQAAIDLGVLAANDSQVTTLRNRVTSSLSANRANYIKLF